MNSQCVYFKLNLNINVEELKKTFPKEITYPLSGGVVIKGVHFVMKWTGEDFNLIGEIAAEDGIVTGYSGEVYQSPMTAIDTWGPRERQVKKGDSIYPLFPQFKEVTSFPKRVKIIYTPKGERKYQFHKMELI